MKTNFHTHTARCGHASGRDEEYVQSAIRGGYQVLGFADHSPWRFASSYRSHMRMNPQEQFQDLLMAALYDCNVSGGKAIMYTTTITDNVEDIEAEAHVLDVGKILKQNLEECE